MEGSDGARRAGKALAARPCEARRQHLEEGTPNNLRLGILGEAGPSFSLLSAEDRIGKHSAPNPAEGRERVLD